MNRINVSCEVTIYEVDGDEVRGAEYPKLTVKSHWNADKKVVIRVHGVEHTVVASDLLAAIKNATNAR